MKRPRQRCGFFSHIPTEICTVCAFQRLHDHFYTLVPLWGRKVLTNKSFPSRTLSFCSRYTLKAPTIKAHNGWQGPKTTCHPFRTIAGIMKSSVTQKEQTQSLEIKSVLVLRYSYNLLESKSLQKLPESHDNGFPILNTETENAMRGAASLLIYPTENR